MPTRLQISSERKRLRTRIRSFYDHFGRQDWRKCYQFLDPALRRDGKVDFDIYRKSLSRFFDHYGPMSNLKLAELEVATGVKNKHYDNRDFAYGVLLRHDRRHEPHLLKERWVKSGDNWYTRMVGLVVHEGAAAELQQ